MYRELAPISSEAWEEIDARASEVLKSYLSARRVVKVNGPKGLDYNVITEGRLGSVSKLKMWNLQRIIVCHLQRQE